MGCFHPSLSQPRSGSVLALGGAAAVLLRKDAVRLGTLGAVPLPAAALLFALTEAVSITRGLLPPHAAHLAGAACGPLFVALRRALLFRRCRLHAGRLAERHVPLRRLLGRGSPEEVCFIFPAVLSLICQVGALTALDLSFARSLDGSWPLGKFRGFFDELQAARLTRLRVLDLSGCAFRGELRLERLPPSLEELRLEHAAVALGGSVAALPHLRLLRLSGRRASLAPSFAWAAAAARLEELLLLLPPTDAPPLLAPLRLAASPRLRRLALDGVAAVVSVPRPAQLEALHLGRGARLEWPPEVVAEGFVALRSLGASSPDALPALPAPAVQELYLDLADWGDRPFPDLPVLFPALVRLTLQNAPRDMRVAVPPSVRALRLIDCDTARVAKSSGLVPLVETAERPPLFRRLPRWLRQ